MLNISIGVEKTTRANNRLNLHLNELQVATKEELSTVRYSELYLDISSTSWIKHFKGVKGIENYLLRKISGEEASKIDAAAVVSLTKELTENGLSEEQQQTEIGYFFDLIDLVREPIRILLTGHNTIHITTGL